jgi:hypothetical protein
MIILLTIHFLAEEKITPLEHLANFLKRAYQESSDEDSLQEEDLSDLSEEDNEDNYQEFELCLTDESSSDEDPVDK